MKRTFAHFYSCFMTCFDLAKKQSARFSIPSYFAKIQLKCTRKAIAELNRRRMQNNWIQNFYFFALLILLPYLKRSLSVFQLQNTFAQIQKTCISAADCLSTNKQYFDQSLLQYMNKLYFTVQEENREMYPIQNCKENVCIGTGCIMVCTCYGVS